MEANSKGKMIAGWIMSALAVAVFFFSASMKLSGSPQVVQGFDHFGWSQSMLLPLGILELTCAVLYLVPPISVLGGVILTGYLGGAVATHIRLGEPVYLHIFIGILIWGGLFGRVPALRKIFPLVGK